MRAKLSSKFQLSIPKKLREHLKLKAGQQFTMLTRGNIIELIPIRNVEESRGMLNYSESVDSSEYRDRQERNLK